MLEFFTISMALKDAVTQFVNSPTPALDAEILLEHVLHQTKAYLYVNPDKVLTPAQHQRFVNLVEQRAQGVPIAYITGHQGFWDLVLLVTKDVLIPRPETELLIEIALQLFPADKSCVVADLGTGSGAIALAIAHARPNWQLIAMDNSTAAIAIAKKNADHLELKNVSFILGDFCESLPDYQFDLIVSNPPYIAENDSHLRQGDVQFEPREALVAGKDGLDAIRKIAAISLEYLQPGGYLLLEHGFDQAQQVRDILANCGYQNPVTKQDLAGHPRASMCVKSKLERNN
ncbi:MAG: peptide chain release factor N(5)-glutamine methyltransferase [Gammaproteobacteria bacterium]